jgi:hypothetical protein
MLKRSREITTKGKFFLDWRNEYQILEEQKKIHIWKKLIKTDGLISYWTFSLVSNIHERINLKASFFVRECRSRYSVDELLNYKELFLKGWFFHNSILKCIFKPSNIF